MPLLFDVADHMIGPVQAAPGDLLTVQTRQRQGAVVWVMREEAPGELTVLRTATRHAVALLLPLLAAGVLRERVPGDGENLRAALGRRGRGRAA